MTRVADLCGAALNQMADWCSAVTSLQAKGSDLRAHFKNTREAAQALKGMELVKAKRYLEDVLDHKRAIPFRRFCGGIGRTAQVGPRLRAASTECCSF